MVLKVSFLSLFCHSGGILSSCFLLENKKKSNLCVFYAEEGHLIREFLYRSQHTEYNHL
jgi:hypothetical protein